MSKEEMILYVSEKNGVKLRVKVSLVGKTY